MILTQGGFFGSDDLPAAVSGILGFVPAAAALWIVLVLRGMSLGSGPSTA